MEIGRESQSVGLRIYPPGKVLQTDKRDAPPADDQLAGVGTTEPDHQIGIGRLVDLENLFRAGDRIFRELNQIDGRS